MAAAIGQGLGWNAAWAYMTTRNSLKRVVIVAVANRILDNEEKRGESQANRIANAVGRMLSGKAG